MSNCTIQCPYCNSAVDVIMAIELLTSHESIELLQDIPLSFVGVLLRYLELFKPIKQNLRWSRRLKLTKDLIPMIKAAQVKRNGIAYAAPLPAWEAAMLHMASRPPTLSLPLTGHGYLLSMLANKGEQHAAKLEQDVEHKRQHRAPSVPGQGLPPVDAQQVTEMLQQETERKRQAQTQQKPPDGWQGAVQKKS